MSKKNHLFTLSCLGFAASLLSACAGHHGAAPALGKAADHARIDASIDMDAGIGTDIAASQEFFPGSSAYADDHNELPWLRYRLALYLPDPEHSTLEAEPAAPGAVGDGSDGSAPASDASPPDLWDRLRAGYGFPTQHSPRIDAEIAWYTRHPEYLVRTVERARPYLHLIVEALDRRGMPMEIALLPIVESAYQPFAYSHGRAAGLWQFVPGTASRYGLKQNWWYDGRRDVLASTRAALDYLQYLHAFFDGDWMLALAAYNSGEGTVRRAVTRNRDQGRLTDFWSLDLPRETRAYVPKLLALGAIFSQPEEHEVELPSIADAPVTVMVDVGGQIDLAKAAELAGIGLEELYRLNPAFNRWATDPDGPHTLLLPAHTAERFTTALAGLGEEQRVAWRRHLIRDGETLGQIARHYRTTVSVLSQINGIDGHVIRAGRSLLVPVAMRSLDNYALSDEQRRQATQATPQGGSKTTHLVRNGDTLWDIARKHGVGVRQIAQWNAMAPGDVLRPGQRLVIWSAGTTATARAPAGAPAAIGELTQRISYVVRKGDSLSRISQRFNVKVSELQRWNSLSPNTYLQPGQRLTLYVDVTRQTANL
jgi:membrane-bound lytic murein transglycosylase D